MLDRDSKQSRESSNVYKVAIVFVSLLLILYVSAKMMHGGSSVVSV